jgi:hypothetical protein
MIYSPWQTHYFASPWWVGKCYIYSLIFLTILFCIYPQPSKNVSTLNGAGTYNIDVTQLYTYLGACAMQPACPHVRIEEPSSNRRDFREITYLWYLLKFADIFRFFQYRTKITNASHEVLRTFMIPVVIGIYSGNVLYGVRAEAE